MSERGRAADRTALVRAGEGRMLLGVCAGISRWSGVDLSLVRAGFLLSSAIGGIGPVAYAVAAVAIEGPPDEAAIPSRRARLGSLLGIVVLTTAIQIAVDSNDSAIDPGTTIPAALLLGGVALVWRRSAGVAAAEDLGSDPRRVARITAGLGLVAAGVILFGGSGTDLSSGAAAAIAAGIVAAGAGLVFAPRLASARSALEEARRQRIRAEEQEALAARLHDSVLQTLALIQREDGDGGRAAALARRQERELRGVLYGEQRPGEATLATALGEIVSRIEEQHRIRVELIQPRDLPLDDRTGALAAAAGEAITNAAKHSGTGSVSVMVRVDPTRATIFVRDRGCGFDPAEAAAGEGQGIAGSIEARMARAGGSVRIESEPGGGTEVEISVPVAAAEDDVGEGSP